MPVVDPLVSLRSLRLVLNKHCNQDLVLVAPSAQEVAAIQVTLTPCRQCVWTDIGTAFATQSVAHNQRRYEQ